VRAENRNSTVEPVNDLPVRINHDWCKKCGICIAFCPRQVLAFGAGDYPELVDAEGCTRCKMCELMCPDFAVVVADRPAKKDKVEEVSGQ